LLHDAFTEICTNYLFYLLRFLSKNVPKWTELLIGKHCALCVAIVAYCCCIATLSGWARTVSGWWIRFLFVFACARDSSASNWGGYF